MTEISNYDFFGYDYTNYWKQRRYEDLAEKNILNKILNKKTGSFFLDIGGSYGRLASTYSKRYKKCIVLDYSLQTLQKNRDQVQKEYPNVEFIAANAYKMPFKNDSFDGALMVRVLHHIQDSSGYFSELKRIMGDNSTYIQEFANKVNLKASLRAILHLNFEIFSKEPFQQPTTNNFEGTKSGEEAIFLNYHPTYVKEQLKEKGFQIQNKYGCSYLRIPILKKMLGDSLLFQLERILQVIFKNSNIAPSIIYEAGMQKNVVKKESSTNLEDILACPKCHGALNILDNEAMCKDCQSIYKKESNIWDFRID